MFIDELNKLLYPRIQKSTEATKNKKTKKARQQDTVEISPEAKRLYDDSKKGR